MRRVDPKTVVRAFLGMFVHHSLNNNLWEKSRTMLKISNEEAAREFTAILLNGITACKDDETNIERGIPELPTGGESDTRIG